MQKKLLLSLLVASGSLTALADINVEGFKPIDWTAAGLVGTELETDSTSNLVKAVVGTGTLSQTVKGLPAGKYNLSFTELNNCTVTVKVEEKNLVIAAAENLYTFELTEKTSDVIIEINPTNVSFNFYFKGAKLDIVFNWNDAYETLTLACDDYKNRLVPSNDPSANSLSEKYGELKGKIKVIREKVESINTNQTLETYVNLNLSGLEDETDEIHVELKDLDGDIKEYNDAAKEQNAKYEIYKRNEIAKEEWIAKVDNLETLLDGAIKAADEAVEIIDGGYYTDSIKGYVNDKCDIYENDIKNQIADFKNSIENAYNDPYKDDIEVSDQFETIKNKIDNYRNEYPTYITTAKYYYEIQGYKSDIEVKYSETFSAIAALEGIDTLDYKNVFVDSVSQWLAEAYSAKTTAVAAFDKVESVEEATEDKFENCKVAYNNACNELNKIAANKDLVDNQNKLMLEALDAIKKQQDAINAVKTEIEQYPNADIDSSKLDALQGELDGINTKVDTNYRALTLTESDFDLSSINTELGAFNQEIQSTIESWESFDKTKTKLTEDFEGAKTAVEKLPEVLQGKFDGTITSIQAAINALNVGDATEDVANAITNLKTNVEKLGAAYTAAYSALSELKSDLDDLNEVIEKKTIIDGSSFSKDIFKNGDYATLTAEISNFGKRFNKALEAEAQQCYDLLIAVEAELQQYLTQNKVEKVLIDFEDKATNANLNVAKDLFTEVKDKAEAKAGVNGIDKITFTDAEGTLNDISSDIDAALKETPIDPNTFTKCDEDIYTLITLLKDKKKDIQILVDFDPNYKEIQEAIEAAAATNKNSYGDAKKYFADLLGSAEDTEGTSYYAQLAKLKADVQKAVEDGTLQNDTTSLSKKAQDLVKAVNNLNLKIKNNQSAYVTLLEEANTTSEAILDVKYYLEGMIKSSGITVDSTIEGWQAEINGLLDSLNVINRNVVNSHNKGEVSDNQSTYEEQYLNLAIEADNLRDNITGENGFNDLVATANNEFLDKWVVEYEYLRTEYVKSVETFNSFSDLKDVGYRTAILDSVGTNEPIYKYAKEITDLDRNVREGINAYSDSVHVMTQADYETLTENTIETQMHSLVSNAKGRAIECAKGYFNALYLEKKGVIDAAIKEMDEAGIDSTYYVTNNSKKILIEAKTKYDKTKDDALVTTVDVLVINLRDIPKNFDVNKAAANQWEAEYSAAKAELEDLVGAVDTYTKVDEENENFAKFDEAEAGINDLVGSVATLENFKNLQDELNRYLQAARDAKKALKEANDEATAADEAYQDLANDVDSLYESLEKLEGFANGLAGGVGFSLSVIKKDIDDIQNKIDNKSSIEEIRADIVNANSKIDADYDWIALDEKEALLKVINDLKVAFNNAVAAEKLSGDSLVQKSTEINNLATKINSLYEDYLIKVKTADEFKNEAQGYEVETTKLLEELQALVTSTTDKTTTLATLDGKFNEVESAITKGKNGQAEILNGSYDADYDDLLEELNGIKEQYDDDTTVILYEGKYLADINDILNRLNDLNEEVERAAQEAQDKAVEEAASIARYDKLNESINKTQEVIDSLKGKVADEYNVDAFDDDIVNQETALYDIDNEVKSQYDGDGISEDEYNDFNSRINDVNAQLDQIALDAAKAYATNATGDAVNKYSAALVTLKNSNVINSTKYLKDLGEQKVDIEVALNDLETALQKEGATNEDKINAYETCAETLKGIIGIINDIVTDINKNTYVLGDINQNPDGDVDVADLQMLLNWVGKQYTYADVAEMYGPAVAAAGDINGSAKDDENDEYNIIDVTGLIRLILDQESGNAGARYALSRTIDNGAVSISMAPMGEIDNGVRRYAVSLSNAMALCSGQFDIDLPNDCELVDVTLSSRAEGHAMQVFESNGKVRVLVFSLNNEAFTGETGEIIYIDVRGKSTPSVDSALFSDKMMKGYNASNQGMSLIDTISEGAREVKETIYNAAGQTMRAMQRGFNIIRKSDGTVTKEIKK